MPVEFAITTALGSRGRDLAAHSIEGAYSVPFPDGMRDRQFGKFLRRALAGRMHVRVNLFGIEEEGFYDHSRLYAFSDDMGRTFFRADGSPVTLPLTSNPAPAHNANVARNANGQWLELWLDVLRVAGVDPSP